MKYPHAKKSRDSSLLQCLERIVTWILIIVSARTEENVVLALNWELHYYILISSNYWQIDRMRWNYVIRFDFGPIRKNRIWIFYTHINLTNKWFIPSFQREKQISVVINFLIKGDFQASVKIIMTPSAKVVKLNSEKKKARNLRTIYRMRSFKLIHI